jgi:hypothetical protein
MRQQLREYAVQVLRIHVSGDFYDTSYAEKWHEIIRTAARIRFFAYTRSWRRDEFIAPFVRLAQLPNMRLWFSEDRESGPAFDLPNVRRAYMAVDDFDALRAPEGVDMVFRDQTDTVIKKINGSQVCPVENGVVTQVRITCSSCRLCWR